MANNGRTIILSIHQPRYSIYRLFDSLTLLVNGKQVLVTNNLFVLLPPSFFKLIKYVVNILIMFQ